MRDVAVIGVGMTNFGKFLEKSMKALTKDAVEAALKDAGIDKKQLEIAYVGNAVAGLVVGQECIRGQVVLRPIGIEAIPIINVENACASSSTAFQGAWMSVACGAYDIALALGVEKLHHEDKSVSFKSLSAAMDVDMFKGVDMAKIQEMMAKQKAAKKGDDDDGKDKKKKSGGSRSVFMDFYAAAARGHMSQYGTTAEHLAKIASKNHFHSSMNPRAQYRDKYTVEEVLASPMISPPLTRLMCSPIGDGAAATIIASKDAAKKLGISKPIWVAASTLLSGMNRGPKDPDIVARTAKKAYEMAGLGPEDINCAEVHDATAFGELIATEMLGFCKEGEGGPFAWDGHSTLGGKLPVNTSGGLESKGHPIGASGTAQICECVWQLRGEAGDRQVENARVALTQNGGGALGNEAAAMSVHIFKA